MAVDTLALRDPGRRLHIHIFIDIHLIPDQPPHLKLARVDHRHGQILQLTVAVHLTCRGHSVTRYNVLERNLTLEFAQSWNLATGPIQHTHAHKSFDAHLPILRHHRLQNDMSFFCNQLLHISLAIRDCEIIIHGDL